MKNMYKFNEIRIRDDYHICKDDWICKNNKKEKILVVGEVQSGKTSKIIKEIEHLIELKYSYLILFGGTTNLLTDQTKNRIKQHFKKNEKYQDKYIKILSNEDLKNNLNPPNFDNTFYIFNLLKGTMQIEKFIYKVIGTNNWTGPWNNENNNGIAIIDDECDWGSVTNKELNKNNKAIKKLIEDIWSHVSKGKFIQFTGTPFANIMADKNDKLYPDKIHILNPPIEYCGSEFFLNDGINCYHIDNNLFNKNSWNEDIIKEYFYVWLITTYFFQQHENENNKSSFLINVCIENSPHEKIEKIIRENIELIIKNHDNDITQMSIENILKKYASIFKIIDTNKKDLIDNIFDWIWKKIIPYFHKNKESIVVLNSEQKKENFNISKINNYEYSIIIGGNLLSRGCTFENLLTEIMINSPYDEKTTTADALLQRCRWFGYRKKDDRYKNMIIVINKKIMETLKEVNEVVKFIKNSQFKYSISDIRRKLKEFQKNFKHCKLTYKGLKNDNNILY